MRNSLVIAFDLQGTLIDTETEEDQLALIYLIKRFKKAGHTIMVWTGGNVEDIDTALKELGLKDFIDYRCSKRKPPIRPDIAFDDNPKAHLLGSKATILV
jgi:phosphoglycolate phosphatase-like HAD superfamily hydrolase